VGEFEVAIGAKKLIEAQSGGAVQQFAPAREAFDYPLVIAT
jgi:hypothetical protein